jgi:hypothetical protein
MPGVYIDFFLALEEIAIEGSGTHAGAREFTKLSNQSI